MNMSQILITMNNKKTKKNDSFSYSSTILTAPTSIDLMQTKLDELVKNFDD